ncbi:MAG: zinc ribbon domain-containing protein [Oscillospiraceae bacterium]
MKLIKCPKCGEMYSDSYKTCPFCQEDEALKGRSAAPHRKVTKHRRAPSILGPAMVLVVVLAAVLVGVLLFGGKGSANKPADKPPVEEPTPAPTEPLTLDQTTLNMNQGRRPPSLSPARRMSSGPAAIPTWPRWTTAAPSPPAFPARPPSPSPPPTAPSLPPAPSR